MMYQDHQDSRFQVGYQDRPGGYSNEPPGSPVNSLPGRPGVHSNDVPVSPGQSLPYRPGSISDSSVEPPSNNASSSIQETEHSQPEKWTKNDNQSKADNTSEYETQDPCDDLNPQEGQNVSMNEAKPDNRAKQNQRTDTQRSNPQNRYAPAIISPLLLNSFLKLYLIAHGTETHIDQQDAQVLIETLGEFLGQNPEAQSYLTAQLFHPNFN
eukprot:TRINITY_DN564_c0_g1_i24.p1 TRINITY_DN564_c0_g1~~TRINITY_DN564_c0_g1_i24.p1  ORF type:complete len:211 (-),score=37.75 TRINITY_DN564_c0_g1_i24:28-660(-)